MIFEKILTSLEPVIKNAKHVSLNNDAINVFVESVDLNELNNSDIKGDKALSAEMSPEDHIAYAFVNGTLQFYFWGDPKWTIEIDGVKYDGSEALIRSIKRAINEGYDILKPENLIKLSDKDLEHIFRGEPEIPFLKERGDMLRKLGQLVLENYSGLFSNIVLNAGGDLNVMVENLVNELPSVYDDSAIYYGYTVHLYKRVQILVSYIFQLSKVGLIPYKVFGKEGLAGLADYRAPQILRSLGILEYSKHLENLVDNKIEILEGSDEEIEIRAFTLEAEHEIALALRKKIPEINDSLAHKILWFRCQKLNFDKPYHRTKTIWY